MILNTTPNSIELIPGKSICKCGHRRWVFLEPERDMGSIAVDSFICAWCKKLTIMVTNLEIELPQHIATEILAEEYKTADVLDKIKIMAIILGSKDDQREM
jgi:hypothetical protein